MKRQFFLTMVLTIGLVGFNQAIAVTYCTDFSTDPGWTTDQPSNYHWDEPTESYFIHNTNTHPCYYPNRYAGKTLNQPVDSFELQWDVNVTRCDWSSGLYFGVWDSSLNWYVNCYDTPAQVGEYIIAEIGSVDGGRIITFWVAANGIYVYASTYTQWSLNEWYTFKISYDSDTKIAMLEVFDRDTAQSIWTSTLAVPGGGFTRDLQFLGSNLGFVGRCNSGCPGFSCSAVLEANIDNVCIVSEPAIAATVDIDPNTLNLQSNGKWITCYISFPVEVNVADVNSNTVLLNGTIKADWTWVEEEEQMMMAKFSRSAIQDMLQPGQVELRVSGELINGRRFEGTDTITVINKGKSN